MRALGLMSGTSADGIDLALIDTDGERIAHFGPVMTVPLTPTTRAAIREASRVAAAWDPGQAVPGAVREAEARVTEAHRAAIEHFLARTGTPRDAIGVIGFHGQTILHRPDQHLTWQIGDGLALAYEFSIDVVGQFRLADVAAGGQGAPFAPLYHQALARGMMERDGPIAVLNIGGVSNLTWIGLDPEEAPVAFDCGPGNALIDDWALAHTGRPVDADGALAGAGEVDIQILNQMMDHPFFDLGVPKSLDRDDFTLGAVRGLAAEDGAATLTAFTVEAIAQARVHFPRPVTRFLVTGGGRHNPVMMEMLGTRLGVAVQPVESAGWRGDSIEAEAFAYLAVRALRGLALSLPTTTGVPVPMPGGQVFRPMRMSR
ncbi:anhydro-N-acetylmuramic acid kinase [Oleomonas cavernae]|uniref:Anhydro-N-acetylmuramic acid kinase n=2 Tax=Oleomonas cavernae TaxID=2320859 RepID=A0A418WIU5_9PROT|nr:anhydro-N-acetylmuramic acid kinase [Oleomonas cavernae]